MKLLFTRGPLLFLRVVIYLVIAVALMWSDAHVHSFHRFRNHVSAVAYPVQWTVSLPSRMWHWVKMDFKAHESLLQENKTLRAKQLLLEEKLQRFQLLVKENKTLKQLLQSSETVSSQVKVARILAVNLNPALHEVVVNAGTAQGAYVGQPVLDAHGVMGQVIDVGRIASKVLLLTDTRSAIPVQDTRNGLRAIAVGDGKGQLTLINVPKTTPVMVGDQFVCSGLAQRFPVGYPVGVVTTVLKNSGQRFIQIKLQPSAHLDESMHVLLVRSGTYRYQDIVKKLLESGS